MYWLIEPEMSSSATIGGALRARPEILQVDDRAAGLEARAQGAADVDEMAVAVRREAPRLHLVEREHQPLDRLLGGGDLGRRHLREVLALQQLAVGDGEARVDLVLGLGRARSRAGRRTAPPRPAARRAWAAPPRRAAAPAASARRAACRDSRGGGRRCGTPGRTAACARAASRTPRAASSRSPRGCRRRRPARPRAHRAPRRARPESRQRAARARSRGCFRRAPSAAFPPPASREAGSGRVHSSALVPASRGRRSSHSAARSSARTSSSSSLALVPSMRAMSS